MGTRRRWRSPSVRRDSRIWLTTTTLMAIKRRRLMAEGQAVGAAIGS
jgi:hypothetical protein